MSTLIHIDIETIPSDTPPKLEELHDIDYLVSQGSHPKNLKDATKIDIWYVTKQEQLNQKQIDDKLAAEAKQKEQHAKQALNSMEGRIFCVSVAVDDDPVETFAGDEVVILDSLFGRLETFYGGYTNHIFVGHNIWFDLLNLYHKSILHKSKLRHILPNAKDKHMVIDTMKEWNLGQYGKYTKLSDIAKFLGIEQKDEIDGSQVWDAYKRGNFDQIIAHCESDVEVVRALNKLL